MSIDNVNLFWDNSNIWLVGQKVCMQREPHDVQAFRIHFENLFDFVINNRKVSYAFVGGSIPPQTSALWQRFRNLGIEVETQERGAIGGGEVAVDESIQLKMANRLLDLEQPETIVLLTGDGAGYSDGKGFIAQLDRAIKKGWRIEVVSWDAGCNRHLKRFAQANGLYIPLENAYEKVTFINDKRWAE